MSSLVIITLTDDIMCRDKGIREEKRKFSLNLGQNIILGKKVGGANNNNFWGANICMYIVQYMCECD